ncbi:hypothetical protein BH23GEM9_BH23GEM9_05810 [soil metagenome]
MSRIGWLVTVSAAAILVWVNSPDLPWPSRSWVTGLLAVLPALMIVQAQQLRELDSVPRSAAYISSVVSLWILAGLTLLMSHLSGFPSSALGLAPMPPPQLVLWTVALTGAGIGVLFGFRLAGFREAPLLKQLLPSTANERALFVGVSVTAGICEEIVFRGFLIHALLLATGSLPLTVLLSSGVFGIVHAYQQPIGALRAALLGALLALPLLLHGSIYPAILAHILIDVLSGLWLARYLLR